MSTLDNGTIAQNWPEVHWVAARILCHRSDIMYKPCAGATREALASSRRSSVKRTVFTMLGGSRPLPISSNNPTCLKRNDLPSTSYSSCYLMWGNSRTGRDPSLAMHTLRIGTFSSMPSTMHETLVARRISPEFECPAAECHMQRLQVANARRRHEMRDLHIIFN